MIYFFTEHTHNYPTDLLTHFMPATKEQEVINLNNLEVNQLVPQPTRSELDHNEVTVESNDPIFLHIFILHIRKDWTVDFDIFHCQLNLNVQQVLIVFLPVLLLIIIILLLSKTIAIFGLFSGKFLQKNTYKNLEINGIFALGIGL